MDIASVRALKEELVTRALSRRLPVRRALPQDAAVAASALPEFEPPPPLALGIAREGGEHLLAVRVVGVTPGLQAALDEIVAAARGEVAVKLVGRVVKQRPPWHRQPNRPLLLGGSLGHVSVTAGTLGAVVVDESDGARVLLSNNHILADENRAGVGDRILQPARRDGGADPADAAGRLLRFVALHRRGNRVDGAVARLGAGVRADATTLTGLGALNGLRPSPLRVGDRVSKVGRTTGVTHGRVSAVELDDLRVEYDTGVLIFDDQIEVEPEGERPFSLGGDSGSLIVDGDLRAAALLFAGNDWDVTYANPISEVLTALNCRLA